MTKVRKRLAINCFYYNKLCEKKRRQFKEALFLKITGFPKEDRCNMADLRPALQIKHFTVIHNIGFLLQLRIPKGKYLASFPVEQLLA